METQLIGPEIRTRNVMFDWLVKIETQLPKKEQIELLRNIQSGLVAEFVNANPARKYEISLQWSQKIKKIQYFRLTLEISYAFTNGDAATNSVPVPIVPVPPPPKIPKGVGIFDLKKPEIKASYSDVLNEGFNLEGLEILYQTREK